MTDLHTTVSAVTDRVIERSRRSREAYLGLIDAQRDHGVNRHALSCGNLAHAFAASGEDKAVIRAGRATNIGVITAYNDMLSAHQPYGRPRPLGGKVRPAPSGRPENYQFSA